MEEDEDSVQLPLCLALFFVLALILLKVSSGFTLTNPDTLRLLEKNQFPAKVLLSLLVEVLEVLLCYAVM